jgi:hypothetical protein
MKTPLADTVTQACCQETGVGRMSMWVERHYRLRDGNLQRVNRIATREHARRAGDGRADAPELAFDLSRRANVS